MFKNALQIFFHLLLNNDQYEIDRRNVVDAPRVRSEIGFNQ